MRKTSHLTELLCLSFLFLAACGDDGGGKGEQQDAGGHDAGEKHDAGGGKDSAVPMPGDDAGDQDDAGAMACTFDADLRFGHVGGFVQTQVVAELARPGVLTITRSGGSEDDVTCMPALPACDAHHVDVADISRDLEDADVKAAFAASEAPFYGQVRPDAGTFHVDREDGKSFDMAGDCQNDDFDSGISCTPAPAGVAKLVHDLEALEDAGLASPKCSAI